MYDRIKCGTFFSFYNIFIANIIINNKQLSALEKIHSLHIVHRNLKPKKIISNLVESNSSNKNEIYIIDFRYSKKYRSQSGKYHILNDNNSFLNKGFVNKFSSLNTHLGLGIITLLN